MTVEELELHLKSVTDKSLEILVPSVLGYMSPNAVFQSTITKTNTEEIKSNGKKPITQSEALIIEFSVEKKAEEDKLIEV